MEHLMDKEKEPQTTAVWVMAPAANNVTTASTDTAGGGKLGYYQIPAIRCIANTERHHRHQLKYTDIRQR